MPLEQNVPNAQLHANHVASCKEASYALHAKIVQTWPHLLSVLAILAHIYSIQMSHAKPALKAASPAKMMEAIMLFA